MNPDELKMRVVQAQNLAALQATDHEWDVYAQLRSLKELQTKDRKPYLVLELADVHAVVEAKIWDNAPAAMAAAKAAEPRATVKMRGRVVRYLENGVAIEFVKPLEQAQAIAGK